MDLRGLGFYLHPLPKMRAAEVRVRLRLNLWEKPQYYKTIAGQPSGKNLELYLMHHVRSIFALLEKEKSGVAEEGWCP
jgi:hypothetical protein